MNPLIATLLLQGPPTAQQVMQRLEAYVRPAHSLSAEFTLSSPQTKTVGKALVYFVRPDRLCYTMKWDVGSMIDYRFVGNDRGAWDANYQNRVYDKYYDETTDWDFNYPGSSISGAPTLFSPGFLMDGTLHSTPVGQPKYIGKSQINGVETDEVEAVGQVAVVKIYVAADGKPLRYDILHNGKFEIVADLAKIALNQPVDPSLFSYNPPIGFTEYSVPMPPRPVSIGEMFPVTGWTAKHGAALGASEKTLVMVTAPGCAPSARADALLKSLVEKQVTVAVVSIASDGEVPSDLKGFPELYDPSGKMIKALNFPGTPMFYLLDKSGKVIKNWYGYDPDKLDSFETDILDSVKKGVANV